MKVEKEVKKEKELFVGVGNCVVKKFNPSMEELYSLMGWELKEDSKEPVYTKDDVEVKYSEDGEEKTTTANQVYVNVVVEEVKSKKRFILKFTLTNHDRTNKDGSKNQYISQLAKTSWVDLESNLPDWFKTLTTTDYYDKSNTQTFPLTYRKAKIGEENLYDFLAKWLDINTFNAANSIFLEDQKAFWQGNMKELNSLVGDYENSEIMLLFGVKTDKDDDTKQYQDISSKFFCQGKFMKNFRNLQKNNFEGLEKDRKLYNLNKFVKDSQDSENGYKNFTVLEEFQPYVEGMSPLDSKEVILTESGADY